MTIRNNYALEMIFAWLEGLSILGVLGFLFFDWKTSLTCVGVFLLSVALRNYVKFGQFYPAGMSARTAKAAAMPSASSASTSAQTSAPRVAPVASLATTQPRTTV